jgi:DNA-binding response OmpR family regulator
MVAQGGHAVTILLVEDDEGVREIVREFFVMNGYSVLETHGSDEALRIGQEHAGAIDLLVTDVALRGMSGLELADQLAAMRPGIRVLYMSGSAEGTAARNAALQPGKAYIQKPFSMADLVAKVRQVLN